MGLLARAFGALLVVLAILPASSPAAPRADARAFATAASTAAAEIRATAPQTRVDVAAAEFNRCVNATDRLASLTISPESRARFTVLGQTAMASLVYTRTLPVLERFVSQLERVRTTDSTLRSARAGRRRYVNDLRVIVAVPLPPDPCAQVESWVNSGAPGLLIPELDVRAVSAVLANGGGSRQEARIARGATRLSILGAPRLRARRFSVQGMLSEHLRISQSLIDAYAPPGTKG